MTKQIVPISNLDLNIMFEIEFDPLRDGDVVDMVVFRDKLIVACQRRVWCYCDEAWKLINAIDDSWTEEMVHNA